MYFLYYSALLLFLVLSLFLILLVLIQKGRGGGLSAAFGGVGGNTAFGAKTGDVLTWATSIVFGIFLVLTIGLNLMANTIDARETNPFKDKPAAVAAPTTVPTAAAGEAVDAMLPATQQSAAPTTARAAAEPALVDPALPNPKPTPPPSPTTNPSTKPTAAVTP